MKDLADRLTSRKLWMALLAVSLLVANNKLNLGLSTTDIHWAVAALLSYVGVEGIADVADRV